MIILVYIFTSKASTNYQKLTAKGENFAILKPNHKFYCNFHNILHFIISKYLHVPACTLSLKCHSGNAIINRYWISIISIIMIQFRKRQGMEVGATSVGWSLRTRGYYINYKQSCDRNYKTCYTCLSWGKRIKNQ